VESEPTLSKLDQVLQQLSDREDVHVAGVNSQVPYGYGWVEMVDVIVSPTHPTYRPDSLNTFADELTKGIPVNAKIESKTYMLDGLTVGVLLFDDVLGTEERIIITRITAVEDEPLIKADLPLGESSESITTQLKRRTKVRIYPDRNLADFAHNYENAVRQGFIPDVPPFHHDTMSFTGEELRTSQKMNSTVPFLPQLLKQG
jgi:hypothetical protein